AVEEQFYLFFPLVLTVVGRLTRHRALALLGVALVSLVGATIWLTTDPTGAFYLIPSRTWELMVGSILALLPGASSSTRAWREGVTVAAAAMLLGSFLILTPESTFPGLAALPACLGTALFIRSGAQGTSVLTELLSTRPAVRIGQISYSLYLWHWPILVFTRYLLLREPTALERAGVFVASLVAADLSWRFVETPLRHTRARASVVLAAAAVGSVLTALVGVGFWVSDGLPQRFASFSAPARTEQAVADGCMLAPKQTWEDWGGEASCTRVAGGGKRVLLWGDSHANHLRMGLEGVPDLHATVIAYTTLGCAPILGMEDPTRPNCKATNDHALELVEELHVDRVVLAASWSYAFKRHLADVEDVAATVRALQERGVEVAVMGQVPVYALENPQLLAYRLHQRGITHYELQPDHDRHLTERLAAAMPGVQVFDPQTVWCQDGPCTVVRDGVPIVVDQAHLSGEGSLELVTAARSLFER
ncbi:MAG: acyltransferase, partial [Myxococcales bacterium]|nr:acyltransferase [Myxococcales bacterium]